MKKYYLRWMRMSLRMLRHRKLRHIVWWQALTKSISRRALWIPCRQSVARGLSAGIFFAMILMPFQALAAAIVAMRVNGNIPTAIIACFITNPFTSLFFVVLQYRLGVLLNDWGIHLPLFLNKAYIVIPGFGQANLATFVTGMLASSIIFSLLAFPFVYILARIIPHHLPKKPLNTKIKAENNTIIP